MHSGLAFVSPRLDSIMMIEDLGTHSIHGLTSGDLRQYFIKSAHASGNFNCLQLGIMLDVHHSPSSHTQKENLVSRDCIN
jgi:hypothetical protein